MPHDLHLEENIRSVLAGVPDLVEKRMFGGIAFLIRGNMACGVSRDHLIVRVGSDQYAQSLSEPFTEPFDLTGRPMKGWVQVLPDGYASLSNLEKWVGKGIKFAQSLEPK